MYKASVFDRSSSFSAELIVCLWALPANTNDLSEKSLRSMQAAAGGNIACVVTL